GDRVPARLPDRCRLADVGRGRADDAGRRVGDGFWTCARRLHHYYHAGQSCPLWAMGDGHPGRHLRCLCAPVPPRHHRRNCPPPAGASLEGAQGRTLLSYQPVINRVGNVALRAPTRVDYSRSRAMLLWRGVARWPRSTGGAGRMTWRDSGNCWLSGGESTCWRSIAAAAGESITAKIR